MYRSSFFNLSPRCWWVVNTTPRPLYPLGNTWYPLCTKLDGPQGRSGRVRNISPPQGFDPRTVHYVASRYTDWTIPARLYPVLLHNGHIPFSHSFQNRHQINSAPPEEGGSTFLRSIRTNFLPNRCKDSP